MKEDHSKSEMTEEAYDGPRSQMAGEASDGPRSGNVREESYRRFVDQIIQSFGPLGASQTPGKELAPWEAGILSSLREAFISAGTERIRKILRPDPWVQLNVRFRDAAHCERFLGLPYLTDAIDEGRSEGWLQCFWYMLKAPGLRLRFRLGGAYDRAEEAIRALMRRAQDRGDIVGWEFGMYDAETHQFGGNTGLEIFHRFSDYDTACILRFRQHEATGDATIDTTVFSLLALSDLFSRVAGDAWEEWDLWCEMRLTGRLIHTPEEASVLYEGLMENRDLLESIVFRRDEVLAELHDVEVSIVRDYANGNARVAAALERSACRGSLSYPPRKLLPFYVIFHWNRLHLSDEEQMNLTYFMHALRNPKYPYAVDTPWVAGRPK